MNKTLTGPTPEGVLAVWKPAGWTSHDVVAKARRIIGVKRIGHTGTLDPAVTGVLPICVGRATRMVEYLQEMPKTYEATLRFGIATDTEDLTGRTIEERDASHLDESAIRAAVLSFVGDIEQVPPMVSSVKVDGKRLYELAREGVTIERKARPVTIHDIRIAHIDVQSPQPEVRFAVRCSKGTYIRTLCVDIGRKLGVPAAMAELRRIESAGLGPDDSLTLEALAELAQQGALADKFLPADTLLGFMPRTVGSGDAPLHALQGKPIRFADLQPRPDRVGLWRLYREDGAFLGLFDAELERGVLRAVKVFHPENGHEQEDR
ncbi:tRNA pseudouridine(55) synthase TruB [Cohnella nanjingensis]|uniref:tRNA pseudouridine synthase B n=1 Tax=Cohnella nanjingensis TaxID=1387779 RepID=A0A7X0RSG5_9BACL|nr:tRNA pseudouridine(55) synthase TruB [Cohnella nanjingensis]MBB6672867.1 tRNA pseudouridine(55) synthase TruB [Cohnella nanjingensis]